MACRESAWRAISLGRRDAAQDWFEEDPAAFEARLASRRARNAHVDLPAGVAPVIRAPKPTGKVQRFGRERLPLPTIWALQSTGTVYAGSVSSRRP
jgi:hypothetical protein